MSATAGFARPPARSRGIALLVALILVALSTTIAAASSWIDPAIARIVLRQSQQPAPRTIAGLLPNDEIQSYPLTERELEVLQLIVDGHSNASIADKLFITVGTVKTHVRNILNKLCADDRTQAAVRALRTGLVC